MAANAVVGVIQQFIHPPPGLCSFEVIPGAPFTGLHGFQRIRGPVNVDAFGIAWLITAAPAGYGLNVGAGVNYYDREVLGIDVFHRFWDGSLKVSQSYHSRLVTGYLMFDQSLPHVVDVLLAPFVEASFDWILLL